MVQRSAPRQQALPGTYAGAKADWAQSPTYLESELDQLVIRRIAIAAIVLAAVALLLYSQSRVSPAFVSGITETDEIRLGSRLGGRVKRVLVHEGDRIIAGAPLVEFEPYDILQREQQAVAELAMREADLKRLKAGLREEEIAQAKTRVDQLAARLKLLELGPRQDEIEAARERLKAARVQLLFASRDYDRRVNLARTNAVSREEVDSAKAEFDAATANAEVRKHELAILEAGEREQNIDQARARLEEARLAWQLAQKGYRVEEIEQAGAARDAAAAALAVIRQQKTELTIVAPSAGFVDALDLQPGDLVAPNAPVMTLLSDERMWVRAYVPQRFLKLQVSAQIRVTIDSLPDQELLGRVSFVSHQAEFTPSNVQTSDDRAKQVYRIRVTLDNPEKLLRAGMTANVWLQPAGSQPPDSGTET